MPSQTPKAPFLTTTRSLLLLLLAGLCVLHALWTSTGIVYSRHSDLVSEHVGIKLIGREALRTEGMAPLWNPSMNSGTPAFANPQAMYLFPIDLLFVFLPVAVAANLAVLLNVLLAGVSMFLLGRRHFARPATVLACAVAYMLSFRCLAMVYAGWLPKMAMYALAPLLFRACDLAIDRPSRRAVAAVAVVGALVLLQGDMQQLYYAGLACAAWAALRLARSGRRDAARAAACLALGGALAALLAAPALLPRLEFAALSTRTRPSLAFALEGSPAPSGLATFLDPRIRAPGGEVRDEFWEANFYFGTWMVPLWLLAFAGRRRRAALLLLAGLAATVLLCFDTPLLRGLLGHFPGFGLFRQSPRILFLGQLLATCLAGLGLDALAGMIRGRAAAALAALSIAAPVADAWIRMEPLVVTLPVSRVFPAHGFDAMLDRRHNGGRVLVAGPNPFLGRAALLYGTAAWYGIDLVNGVASLELRHYIEYLSILEYGTAAAIPDHPAVWTDCTRVARPEMLRALDVRFVVGDPALNLESMGAERVWQSPRTPVFVFYAGLHSIPLAVWRLPDPLGPAYFATSVQGADSEAGSLRALELGRPAREACVLGLDRDPRGIGLSGGTAALTERGLNRYRYRIESSGTGYLILSQVWYPGWSATLDGAPLRLYRTNHALMGCVVPPGSHELVLRMKSRALDAGLAAAALGAAAVAALLVSRPRRPAVPAAAP